MGWRPEWSASPITFRTQLGQICDDLPRGSSITFLNVTSPADFHVLVTQAPAVTDPFDEGRARDFAWATNPTAAVKGDFSAGWRVKEENGGRVFKVLHSWGDPVNFQSVAAAVQTCLNPFDTAICLGSVVGITVLPLGARDSRVLSMGLMLRRLTEKDPRWKERSLQVVAENHLEQTPLLAVVPKRYLESSTMPQDSLSLDDPKNDMASVERWSPPLPVLECPELPQGKSGTAISKHLQPGELFPFIETRLVPVPSDKMGLAPAVFYHLKDGGWVHDHYAKRPGRRAIKIQLEGSGNDGEAPQPDFVNKNALTARVIAMAMAYPQIQLSVMDLLSSSSGTAEVEFYPPAALGLPVNGETKVAFGVLQHLLDGLYSGYAVFIGVLLHKDGQLILAPAAGEKLKWAPQDRVVCLVRHAAKPPLAASEVEAQDVTEESKDSEANLSAWKLAAKAMTNKRGAPASLDTLGDSVAATQQTQARILDELAALRQQVAALEGSGNPKSSALGVKPTKKMGSNFNSN